ncbi:MAG: MotA/TolQ/ExbB proton channel family protein [Schlesneria sp.]
MLSTTKHRIVPIWLMIVLLTVSMGVFSRPIMVHAQVEDGAKPASSEEPAKASESPARESTLMWLINTSGWIGAVILAISIYFLAIVLQCFLELRAPVVAPPELMEECEALLAKRDFNGIYKVAKESTSELGQLIATGMVGLSTGLSDAREAIDRQGEVITVDMEKRISMLAVIGTLGPLIGLLGTLKGMIASFSVIARSDTQMKASEVAHGISEALVLTFEGVGLSVPAIYFFAFFKNRVATLSVQTLNAADEFIRRLHAAAHKKPTNEAAP